MKRNKIVSAVLILVVVFAASGCAKTPEQSAVVSTKGGLPAGVEAGPLSGNKKQNLNIPAQWSQEARRGKMENVSISIDLQMEQIKTGNLPVLEMEKSTLTSEQMQKLDEYFSNDHLPGSVWEPWDRTNGYSYTGAIMVTEQFLQNLVYMSMEGMKTSKGEDVTVSIKAIEACMNGEASVSQAEGREKADMLCEKIGAKEGYRLASTESVVCFGTGQDDMMEQFPDKLLKAQQPIKGYRYRYTKNIVDPLVLDYVFDQNGVELDQADAYTPPFPVETITVTVTGDGIVGFEWKYPSKEVEVIAENTNLLSADEIFEKLADNLYYSNISDLSSSETSVYEHTIISARLGYSYIPAFGNPQNVWAIPTWFFEVTYHIGDSAHPEVQIDRPVQMVMLSALDGRYISDSVS